MRTLHHHGRFIKSVDMFSRYSAAQIGDAAAQKGFSPPLLFLIVVLKNAAVSFMMGKESKN